jgi:hypothetical protein
VTTTPSKRWDAARVAQARPIERKRVVGPPHVADGRNDCCCAECVQFSEIACRACGMHICSATCTLYLQLQHAWYVNAKPEGGR